MTHRLVSIATSRAVTPATAPVMAARVAESCPPNAPVWTKACVSPPANKPTIELRVLILCSRSLISIFLLVLPAYFTNERKPSDMRLPAAPRNHPPTQTTARPGMLPKTSATGRLYAAAREGATQQSSARISPASAELPAGAALSRTSVVSPCAQTVTHAFEESQLRG